MTTATACAKVILLGEHAVVYGRPALAAAIAPGADATVTTRGAPAGLRLRLAPGDIRVRASDPTDLGRALAAIDATLPGAQVSADIVAALHVPAGGGLGSSAALGVAVSRALGEARVARALTDEETARAALAWEKVFHGEPSGVDHTLAMHGGVGVYSRADGFERVPLGAPLRVLVADSGERAPTREMVASVARIHTRRPAATEKTMDAIAALVRNGALALAAGDLRALGQLMDLDQALLASLMLSTEALERLCSSARAAGALGAKLTGGGGGGCVIAIAPEHEREVLRAWTDTGASTFVAVVG